MANGKITKNFQREQQYTQILGKRIVERFHKENIVLASHLVAFAAFNVLRHFNPALDLYGILRLPTDEFHFPLDLLSEVLDDLQERLYEMEKKGHIKLSKYVMKKSGEELIRLGVKDLGIYHAEQPLMFNKKDKLISESFKLLYYYHNRLDNYQLEKQIKWSKKAKGEELLELGIEG